MAYCTAAELRAVIDKTSAAKDATITNIIIPAAEININDYCNRPDGFEADAVASARVYMGRGVTYQHIDECVEVTAVAVKESVTDTTYTAWAAGDYIECSGDPAEPNFNRLPYTLLVIDPTGDQSIFTGGRYSNLRGFPPDIDTGLSRRGVPTVQVTAKWGYSVVVPPPVKVACLIESARLLKRFEGAMGDALASGELGQILYTSQIDPDAALMLKLGRLIRPAVG